MQPVLPNQGAMRELDRVAQWLWVLWRLLLFCSLLSSPMSMSAAFSGSVPGALLRFSQVLRALRHAALGPDDLRVETPLPFRDDDGERLRRDYQARYGPRGHRLVAVLGGSDTPPGRALVVLADGPKEYLTPPEPPAHYRGGKA